MIFIAIFRTTLCGTITRPYRTISTLAGSSIRRSIGRPTITRTTIGRTICAYVIVEHTVLGQGVDCNQTAFQNVAILSSINSTGWATIICNLSVIITFTGPVIRRSVLNNTISIITIKSTVVVLRDTPRGRNRFNTDLIQKAIGSITNTKRTRTIRISSRVITSTNCLRG